MKNVLDKSKLTVSARFPPVLVKKLRELAKSERRSVSAMLQILVENAVAHGQKP